MSSKWLSRAGEPFRPPVFHQYSLSRKCAWNDVGVVWEGDKADERVSQFEQLTHIKEWLNVHMATSAFPSFYIT